MSVAIAGSTVLVTGANGGLGVEFVRQAVDLGAAKVYASARHPRDWDDERVEGLALDITDEASIAAAAAAASDTTIVVNNAGIALLPDRLFELDMADIRKTFETNFFGPIVVARAFAPIVGANGGGAFLNVHSVLSWVVGDPSGPTGGHQAYAASKAALWSATNSMRLSLAGQGTHVLGLHLGYTASGMTANIDAELGDPADVVCLAYAGLASGKYEVLADATTLAVKQALSAPIEALYPQLKGD